MEDQNLQNAQHTELLQDIDNQKFFLKILTEVEQEMKTFVEQQEADNTLEQELLSLETI